MGREGRTIDEIITNLLYIRFCFVFISLMIMNATCMYVCTVYIYILFHLIIYILFIYLCLYYFSPWSFTTPTASRPAGGGGRGGCCVLPGGCDLRCGCEWGGAGMEWLPTHPRRISHSPPPPREAKKNYNTHKQQQQQQHDKGDRGGLDIRLWLGLTTWICNSM